MTAAPTVLIVGAGPTGLTAAVELARRGIVPVIVDRRKGPSGLSRAVGVSMNSIRILTPSGAAQGILDEAIAFEGITFSNGARRIARFPVNFDDRTRIYGLPQDRTEHHIAQALTRLGGAVRYSCPLEALDLTTDGATATLAGQKQRFDLVIGADGTHSTVRQAVGLDYPGFDLPGDWSIADVDVDGWPDPRWFQGFMLADANVAVVVPLAVGRYRVIASLPDALAALPVPMNVTRIRRQGVFRISVRQVDRYQVGPVFLAGDAAHCHSPFGGRGMNLGIADAADLAARIAEGRTDGYSDARHAEGAKVLRFSENGRRNVQSTGLRRAFVITVMRLVSALPPLRRAAMRAGLSG